MHLDRKDPPCWFITGETDDPSTQAAEFRERMKELKISSGLTVIKDAPHPFLGKQVWFDETINSADKFFSEPLKQQPPQSHRHQYNNCQASSIYLLPLPTSPSR